MIRQDYILRMIEELGQMLRRIRQRRSDRHFEEADAELDKAFTELLGSGAEAVGRLPEQELLARLTVDAPTLVLRQKTFLLVAMLQEAAELHAVAGREEDGQACCLKALNILLTLEMQDADFEMPEFVPKIDLLHGQLRDVVLPLQTLAGLWRHYEGIGAFAQAEDALSELLEAEPYNGALVSEARTFYQRLLQLSNETLAAGNLPRAEVEAALTGLRPKT